MIDVVRDGNRVREGLNEVVFEEGDEIYHQGAIGWFDGLV